MLEILDRLKSLENKVDRIPAGGPGHASGFGPPQQSPSSQPSFGLETDPSSYSTPSVRQSQQTSPSRVGRNQPYRHASAAHKILAWPALQQLLLQILPANVGDMKTLETDGTSFLVRVYNGQNRLPMDESLQERPFVGMQTQATR